MMPPYARTRASIPWAFLRVYRLTAAPRSVVPNGSGRGAPRAHAALPARIMDHPRTVDFIGCETDTLGPGALPRRDVSISDHGDTLVDHGSPPPGNGDPPPRAPPARLPTGPVAEPERTLAIPVRCGGLRGGTRLVPRATAGAAPDHGALPLGQPALG